MKVGANWICEAVFRPAMSLLTRATLREGWQTAVRRTKGVLS